MALRFLIASSLIAERAEEINALFRERNDGPIHYEEGYSTTGMILAGAMIFTGFYLALRAILTSRTPPAAPASTEKKTQ